jgi:hypothetical protein
VTWMLVQVVLTMMDLGSDPDLHYILSNNIFWNQETFGVRP